VGFELGTSHLKSRAVLPEPQLQSILLWLFWGWDLISYLPRLALNHDPSNLSLISRIIGVSQRHPAEIFIVKIIVKFIRKGIHLID
jgi:hypothetical protein